MLSGPPLAMLMQIGTYAKLLSKWVLPHAQQQHMVLSPLRGLCTPHGLVSTHCLQLLPQLQPLPQLRASLQALLQQIDGEAKRCYARYAALPNLAGRVGWQNFAGTQKGMRAGHTLMLLSDFKVSTRPTGCPGQ